VVFVRARGSLGVGHTNLPSSPGGLSQEDLPAALQGTDAAQLNQSEEVRRVLANVRRALGWDERVKGSGAKEIDALINRVRSFWPTQ
jgi:hypothetical protein